MSCQRWLVATTLCAPACTRVAAECRDVTPPDPAPPAELQPFELLRADPKRSEVLGGHILLTQVNDKKISYVTVIDGCGQHRWWHDAVDDTTKMMRTWLGRDGQSILVSDRHNNTNVDLAAIRRIDIETHAEVVTPVSDHHHDFVELPDGRFAYLSRDRVNDDWLSGQYPVAADVIRMTEEAPAVGAPEVLFSTLTDSLIEPYWTCVHMRPDRFLPGHLDWTHANSLLYDDDSATFTMMVRHFDGMVRLDAEGQVEWWLGGPSSTLTPIDGASPPSHAHLGEAWENGALVFDNRNHVEDAASRIVEYEIDIRAGTYREAWSYEHPQGEFFAARGDAHRLPGGNYLIAWSESGEIWEVTPGGSIVWAVDNVAHKAARVQFLPNWAP